MLYEGTSHRLGPLFASSSSVAYTKAEEAEGGKKKKRSSSSTEALEVVVLGLSHHNAPVEVREKLAIPEDSWNQASGALCEYDSIAEAAVLSTCNRFEVYLSGANQYECFRDAIDFLLKRAGGSLDQATLRKSLFMLTGEDAIWHLLRVSAGLDSLIVGEGQILAQVKRSYEHGISTETGGQAGKVVSRMLNTAVSAGKRVRSETGISKGAVSISSAAAEFTALRLPEDAKLSSMEDAKICIIGAGKMARLLLVHLQTQGVKEVVMVNRSPARVLELREEFKDMTLVLEPLERMWEAVAAADVVYPSTAATTTIINKPELQQCLATAGRADRGLIFVDISVPRNVAADCGEVPGVSSYNVDDLKAVVERNTAKRRREMIEAEAILRDEMERYRLWQQSLGAIPLIARLQEKAEGLRLDELSKASKKLSNLSAKDLEAVERLSKGIVAKLLHGPMNHLRQQKEMESTRQAIQQVQQAFQLEDK
jgi:glutamyl-tRNA reductase